jgi:transposase-like protein
MGKQTQRKYEEKEKIVKEILGGASYQYVASKYNVSRRGTIANWKRKYLEGTLNQDNRGKAKKDIEDIDILKKSYALLMEIRKEHHK